MRARERERQRRLSAIQAIQTAQLARLSQFAATQPFKAGSHKEWGLVGRIKGLGWRLADRRTILDRLDAAHAAQDAATIALTALTASLAPWRGTAADLLRLHPGAAASPAALGVLLRRLAPALLAVGIGLDFRREAGTGRRLMVVERAPLRVE